MWGGTAVPSMSVGSWRFTPTTTGRVNLDFNLVTADGKFYCYQNLSPFPPVVRHVLVQFVSPSRVRIDGVLGRECGEPATWTFSPAARDFTR